MVSQQKKYAKKSYEKPVYKRAYAKAEPTRAPRARTQTRRSDVGASPSLGRQVLEAGGTALGAGLGSVFGSPAIGAMAGRFGANMLSTLVGLGDYEVKKNIFMTGRLPQVANIPKAGGTVIRFQEYLGDVYTNPNLATPEAFNIQSFLINGANAETFPWLSQIASNYEQYNFEGLVFEFRSTSADALNSTNTALGSVMMATQYDVSDLTFASKTEMLNYEFSNSVKPSNNCMHMIECAPGQNVLSELYCLDGTIPQGTDPRFYHLGRFSIATVGFQASNVNIGELHVTYQVRLLKPKLYASLGNMNDYALIFSNNYSNAQPIPDNFTRGAQNNFLVSQVSGTMTIPGSSVIKTYRMELFWTGTNPTASTVASPVIANATLNSIGWAPPVGSTTTVASLYFSFTTLGNSKSVSISIPASTLPVVPLGASAYIMRLMQVPQGASG